MLLDPSWKSSYSAAVYWGSSVDIQIFWVGAVISSLLFAFAHNDGHLLIYFFLGFFFSLEYKATGRIWTSMITHVGMNTLVVLVQLAVQKGLV
ncbi:hypothetical protein EFP6CTSP_04145 [Enterococcus faecium]|nr:hypothetical protein EFP6CTSP_04145 [Enterococcus faecium]